VKQYLLDSNVLIQAHRMYYPFDVVPGFWTKLIDLSNRGVIRSIDKVKEMSRVSPQYKCLENLGKLFSILLSENHDIISFLCDRLD